MKRVLLASAFCLGLSVQAHAQLPVTDIGSHVLQQLGIQNQVTELGKWVSQLQAMQQQYQMLTSQYQAIAHLPQNVAGMVSGLTTSPTLQNPFPQSYAITNIANGSALGPVAGLANQIQQTNTYYAPTGDDPAAVEMRARSSGLAGIQAMAVNAMHSLEQRSASLGEFLGGIGSSPDVQQSAAIQARLQLEQNYVAVQQAQATQLATLASVQQQVNQQRDIQAARQSAEEWNAHASAAAGLGE